MTDAHSAAPSDERTRAVALKALAIVDKDPGERFDRFTRLVRRTLDVPAAALSLLDYDLHHYWSAQGLEDRTPIPLEYSFCRETIERPDVLEVPDLASDERFASNPFVTGEPRVRFYAGARIHAPDGTAIGSLCAMDYRPRELDDQERTLLADLALMAENEIAALSLAVTDELTGLANRRGLTVMGEQVLAMATRMGFPVQCVAIDLDGLKAVNDAAGHAAGDDQIRRAADILRRTFRGADLIARPGGDEFTVILTGSSVEGARIAVERLREAVRTHNSRRSVTTPVSLSLGVYSPSPDQPVDLAGLLARADEAMYADKTTRR